MLTPGQVVFLNNKKVRITAPMPQEDDEEVAAMKEWKKLKPRQEEAGVLRQRDRLGSQEGSREGCRRNQGDLVPWLPGSHPGLSDVAENRPFATRPSSHSHVLDSYVEHLLLSASSFTLNANDVVLAIVYG